MRIGLTEPNSNRTGISLSDVSSGKTVEVVALNGGWGFRQKLLSLGIIPGISVKIVRSGSRSPIILSVLGNQVIVGYGMASRVMVK